MQEELIKIKVQKQIVSVSVILLAGKFIAFFLTNSVGILTDALESIVNVMAGFFSLFSIRFAARPRDKEHPFGHGKMELISASVEAILIFLAGLAIMVEGVRRLFRPEVIERLDVGIWIIALAGGANYLLGMYSIRVGKRYDSMALIAGGRHLQSDTWSSVGLTAGLLLLYWTKIAWIDSALAILFGGIIVRTGIGILRKTVAALLDKADVHVLQTMCEELIARRKDDWVNIHNMKVLKYGNAYYVDCGLTVPWYYNVRRGYAVCLEVGNVIAEKFASHIRLNIQTHPCRPEDCPFCLLDSCHFRSKPFVRYREFTIEEITRDQGEMM